MHSSSNLIKKIKSRNAREQATIPSTIRAPRTGHRNGTDVFFQQFSDLNSNAGMVAGVFVAADFGLLTRLFGREPSRRISGPSAEFISVTRLRRSQRAMPRGRARFEPLFAPMNNPYRNSALSRTGFFNPGA